MPTALLSVYNKAGIVEFAQALVGNGWDLLASGGTAKVLKEAGLEVRDVTTIVGEPILGHRVVTLSREIHAGLLAKDTPEDNAELKRLGIARIDLVCVDLYPLEDAIKSGKTYDQVIEMTDIGGPTLLRSAAKGSRIVISTAEMRNEVLQWLHQGKPKDASFRRKLAGQAELVVARYCMASARYLAPNLVGRELFQT